MEQGKFDDLKKRPPNPSSMIDFTPSRSLQNKRQTMDMQGSIPRLRITALPLREINSLKLI
jgi:hypothetical protein